LILWEPHSLRLGLDWNIEQDTLAFGVTLDYPTLLDFKIIDGKIGQLRWGFGPGLFGDFSIPKEKVYSKNNPGKYTEEYNVAHTDWTVGLRLPVLLYFEMRYILVYFQVAPAVSMVFEPSFGFGGFRGSSTSLGFLFYL
jgi:hypothetical protein